MLYRIERVLKRVASEFPDLDLRVENSSLTSLSARNLHEGILDSYFSISSREERFFPFFESERPSATVSECTLKLADRNGHCLLGFIDRNPFIPVYRDGGAFERRCKGSKDGVVAGVQGFINAAGNRELAARLIAKLREYGSQEVSREVIFGEASYLNFLGREQEDDKQIVIGGFIDSKLENLQRVLPIPAPKPAPQTESRIRSDFKQGQSQQRKVIDLQKRLDDAGFQGEIPEEFLCPISSSIMNDPVINSFGYTYDRASIERHLRLSEGDYLDPMSRERITNILVPNLSLRSRILEFVDKEVRKLEEEKPKRELEKRRKLLAEAAEARVAKRQRK